MKKAFAWLEGNGIEYRLHDYKRNGISTEKLTAWLKQASWEALLNAKGMTFRNLPPARQKDLNAARAAQLMADFPSAIRRPVIETDDGLLIGFDPVRYQGALG